jgi:hypothetical protein
LAEGFSLGAGAIHGLQVAASPPAYVINEINVKDGTVTKMNSFQGRKRPSMKMGPIHRWRVQ